MVVIGVRGPFPDIADHVVQPVRVRLETADGSKTGEAVLGGVDQREDALPGVGVLWLFVFGRVLRAGPRRPFPLRFAGQLTAFPLGVGFDVLVGQRHDRELIAALDREVFTVIEKEARVSGYIFIVLRYLLEHTTTADFAQERVQIQLSYKDQKQQHSLH